MSDVNPQASKVSSSATSSGASAGKDDNPLEGLNDLMAQVNQTLSKIDWNQMGKYGKAAGIAAVVILALVLVNAVLSAINFLPIIPGLLELLGIVVLAQWSWENLTTSEKRTAVFERVQSLRKEYLG